MLYALLTIDCRTTELRFRNKIKPPASCNLELGTISLYPETSTWNPATGYQMKKPFLIIINGAPGAGKTILGRKLAQDLNLPFFSKDDIKETLFDVLGWRDREYSQKLGHASFQLLFSIVERQLDAGKTSIVETAFFPKFDTKRFLKLKDTYGFEPFQILCWADEDVLSARFQKRYVQEERHPGHVDHTTNPEQFKGMLQGDKYGELKIGGRRFEIETSDFEKIDYMGLLAAIKDFRDGRDMPYSP